MTHRGFAMKQRWRRIEKLGFELAALAAILEVTDNDLARWVIGKELPVETADMIEVGVAMLEMRVRTRASAQNAPTLPLAPVIA